MTERKYMKENNKTLISRILEDLERIKQVRLLHRESVERLKESRKEG